MRIFLWVSGLTLIFAQAGFGACRDTTVEIGSGSPGYGPAGVYNPDAGVNLLLNSTGCNDSGMTVRLRYTDTDTLRLTGSIKVNRATGRTATLIGKGKGPDSTLTLLESSAAAPALLAVNSRAEVSNFHFVRKSLANPAHTVTLASKGSILSDCLFFMADNSGSSTGALVEVNGIDSTLIERCFFRAPPGGSGRTLAIHTSGTTKKLEIRSNFLYCTGIFVTDGTFHLLANTFTGTKDVYNAVTLGSTFTAPAGGAVIQHNLFAFKDDTLSPIAFAGTVASADSIMRNAWSRSRNIPLAVHGASSSTVALPTGGTVANAVLPRGFSNYADSAPVVNLPPLTAGGPAVKARDYPLMQLRTDPRLDPSDTSFGKIPSIYASNWSSIPSISAYPNSRLFFPAAQRAFTPFNPGRTWSQDPLIAVGALLDKENRQVPSPLSSGSVGASLKFVKAPGDSTKLKYTVRTFDLDHYKAVIPPAVQYFFFGKSSLFNSMDAVDDTAALKAITGVYFSSRAYTPDDSILTVPTEVRTGGDIAVKYLHFNQFGQAPVLSAAAMAIVQGVPAFPSNDLVLAINDAGSVPAVGKVSLTVTRTGSEDIDKIRVYAVKEGGAASDSLTVDVTGTAPMTFNFPVIPSTRKGTYSFYAVPLVVQGSVTKVGPPSKSTATVVLWAVEGDLVYVDPSVACGGAGTSDNPFCSLDEALAQSVVRTILVKASSTVMEGITIAAGSTTDVTISAVISQDRFPNPRPIFRGKEDKEALTILRQNVSIRGFTFEMPPGNTARAALSVNATGVLVDGCFFRPRGGGSPVLSAAGPAVSIDAGATGDMRFINNVVWGFTKAVEVASASPAIRIVNNTFIDDQGVNAPGSSIGIDGGAINATIVNNFFSGIANPLDASVTGKLVLDRNVFSSDPNLRGQNPISTLDNNPRLPSMLDLFSSRYAEVFDSAMNAAISCTPSRECGSIFAGSAGTTAYQVDIKSDVMGKPRTNNREVGAYEFVNVAFPVGRLSLKLEKDQVFSKVKFAVSSRNYDSTTADSVYVWWATRGVPYEDTAVRARRHYSLRQLEDTIHDIADNLAELKEYTFHAALGKRAVGGIHEMGFVFTKSISTDPNSTASACSLSTVKTVCPSENGFFRVEQGAFVGAYTSVIKVAVPAAGLVLAPEFNQVTKPGEYRNLTLAGSLPKITLVISNAGLGSAGSKQFYTAIIEKTSGDWEVNGEDLFLLPEDPANLPEFVSTWRVVKENNKSKLIIEGTRSGKMQYAFGNLNASAAPGKIEPLMRTPPIFDFSVAGDSVFNVALDFKGSGFKTANPLVLVSVVPAGGIATGVLAGKYHSKTLVLSSGISNLHDDLRLDGLYRYFLRAVKGEAGSTTPGMYPPFKLESVDLAPFTASTRRENVALAVAGNGDMAQATVNFPLTKDFKEPNVDVPDLGGKASRGLEVVFTVFDGARISRSRAFIRTRFTDPLNSVEKKDFEQKRWNLFAYPWDEDGAGNLARITASNGWDPKSNWDPTEKRLMKYKGSGNQAGSFVIYDGKEQAGFTYDSGQAIWSGSLSPYKPACISGITVDYQTFSMDLVTGQWNDIGLPFNFSIKWKDVMDSSGITGSPSVWRFDAKRRAWDAVIATTVLHPWEGITYKPGGSSVTLKFPVLDSARSLTPIVSMAKTAAGNNGSFWTARVEAYNATASMDLRIGKGSSEEFFPEAPDVPGQDFRVALKVVRPDGNVGVSRHIQAETDGWQGHWALDAHTMSGSRGFRLKLAENPDNVPVYLVETVHKRARPLQGDSVSLSPEEMRGNDYHLVAGDSRYVEQVLEGLVPMHMLSLSNYPNPFSGSTLIRYALPVGFGKVDFHLRAVNSKGRTVWEKRLQGGNALSYLWDGRDSRRASLPAGFYTLLLEAKAPGKTMFRAHRRLLKM